MRVLEMAEGLAGGYAGKLLSDLGADVVKVESPDGDPVRCRGLPNQLVDPSVGGGLFRYLAASKQSVVVDASGGLEETLFDQLLAAADVILASVPSTVGWDDAIWRRTRRVNPGARIVVISPFGLSGPSAGAPAADLTIQARCGSLDYRRAHDGQPVTAAGELVEWASGVWAAIAALVPHRTSGGAAVGETIDVSQLEAALLGLEHYAMVERQFRPTPPPRPIEPAVPSNEIAADGWVAFTIQTPQQWAEMVAMIGAADLDDPALALASERAARPEIMAKFRERIAGWCSTRRVAEILERAASRRIPVAPILTGETVTSVDHFISRGIYRESPCGAFQMPRSPFLIDGQRMPDARHAPRLGGHDDELRSTWMREPAIERGPAAAAETAGTLEGLRVIDFSAFWAGPSITGLLAGLGADVVKIESTQRPDLMRLASTASIATPRWYEWSPLFASLNMNKRGVTLDLTSPRGHELAMELIRNADVVFESFSPRVMRQLGLDYESAVGVNPSIIYVRQPAYGLSGPWRDRGGFAPTIEAAAGMSWMTGFSDQPPRNPQGPCDPLTGWHTAVALLALLRSRSTSGDARSVHLEVPMIEVALNLTAESVIEFGLSGEIIGRMGNRSPFAAPQGVYPCGGDGSSLSVSVRTDLEWAGMRRALGNPDWSEDDALRQHAERHAQHALLDAQITSWLADKGAGEAAALLLAEGVPAAEVAALGTSTADPQLRARGFFETVEHPIVGTHDYPVFPIKYLDRPGTRWFRRPAPTLGQDNHDVLTELAGVSEAELDQLEAAGVIGTVPTGLPSGAS